MKQYGWILRVIHWKKPDSKGYNYMIPFYDILEKVNYRGKNQTCEFIEVDY